jgi:diguanylate cyclase (GGDEF)-like protein/PAS domain S-box-containing protein
MVDIVWTIDRDFQTTYVSPSIENVLGFTPEERKRQALEEVITPESVQNVQMKFLEELQRDEDSASDPNRPVTIEVEYYRKDCSTVWMENIMSAIRGPDGAIVGIHGVSRDITLRKQAEEALRESEQKYRTVLETNPDPVAVYDIEGKVLYLNPAFTRVFGWSSKERFGKKMDVFVPEENWSETKMMIDKVLAGEAFSGIETHRYTKEGKLIPVSISGATYRDLEGNHLGTVVNLRDISEQKSLEEKLERLSYLDGLTGVANRRQFDINLDLEWRRMGRLDKSLSLIMCDIDFFKAYNDTYGHQAGDKCLKAVGNVLKGSAKRAGDLVARYGGEEFTILLPMTDSEKAFIIAEKIQRDINSLKVPHKKSEVSGIVTLSFGIATLFPQTSKSPNDLVELADKALYRAKHEGRNKVIIS